MGRRMYLLGPTSGPAMRSDMRTINRRNTGSTNFLADLATEQEIPTVGPEVVPGRHMHRLIF